MRIAKKSIVHKNKTYYATWQRKNYAIQEIGYKIKNTALIMHKILNTRYKKKTWYIENLSINNS
jgi:hypothetical protein